MKTVRTLGLFACLLAAQAALPAHAEACHIRPVRAAVRTTVGVSRLVVRTGIFLVRHRPRLFCHCCR